MINAKTGEPKSRRARYIYMRMPKLAVLVVAPAVALAFSASPAGAANKSTYAVAGPGAAAVNFLTPSVKISQGGSVSFLNLDGVKHSFTSTDLKTTTVKVGKRTIKTRAPLFDTGLVSGPSATNVKGISNLKPGLYRFICTLHEHMAGTLQVL